MNGYYITRDNPTKKFTIEPQDEILLYVMDIIELVLPKCKWVNCNCNHLTELIVPQGCKRVYCVHNKLTKLIIPKSCTMILCHNNNLHPIIINLFESRDPIKIKLANNLQR
jgi:hypothetical protein